MIYFSEKQYDNALQELRTALEEAPESISVRYYLALVLEEMEMHDEAVVVAEKDSGERPQEYQCIPASCVYLFKDEKG